MASFATPESAALTPEDRMNLTALQRRDPYIVRVIETASQVEFGGSSNSGSVSVRLGLKPKPEVDRK